jgi:hypothetical protein
MGSGAPVSSDEAAKKLDAACAAFGLRIQQAAADLAGELRAIFRDAGGGQGGGGGGGATAFGEGRRRSAAPPCDERQKVRETFEKYSEDFPEGVTAERLLAGFDAERRAYPKLTAAEFLQGVGR